MLLVLTFHPAHLNLLMEVVLARQVLIPHVVLYLLVSIKMGKGGRALLSLALLGKHAIPPCDNYIELGLDWRALCVEVVLVVLSVGQIDGDSFLLLKYMRNISVVLRLWPILNKVLPILIDIFMRP